MKAILFDHYGPPEDLKLGELPTPSPGDGQILVRVRASSVNAADWRVMRASPFLARLAFGLFKPRIRVLGVDVSGQVEAVGAHVTRFKPGDEVFGELFASGLGGFAEYVAAPESAFVHKPARLSFEEAAAVPLAAVTALQALRDVAGLKPGDSVAINGASGGVGTFALQIAKALGAREVTAVCSSRNMDLARRLGADLVIDYAKEDFTAQGKTWDVIVAVNGYHPISHYKRALAPGGRYALVGGAVKQLVEVVFLGPFHSSGGRTMRRVDVRTTLPDLQFLQGLLEAGSVVPVIDRTYPLEQVPAAIAYLEEGHSPGKVVITVSPPAAHRLDA